MYNLKFIAIYNIAIHFLNIHCLKTMIIARDTRAVFLHLLHIRQPFQRLYCNITINVVLNYT